MFNWAEVVMGRTRNGTNAYARGVPRWIFIVSISLRGVAKDRALFLGWGVGVTLGLRFTDRKYQKVIIVEAFRRFSALSVVYHRAVIDPEQLERKTSRSAEDRSARYSAIVLVNSGVTSASTDPSGVIRPQLGYHLEC